MESITQSFMQMHSSIHVGLAIQTFTMCLYNSQQHHSWTHYNFPTKMANRFNNLQRAMQPLAYWYDIIDTHTMLELQSEVVYKVLNNRSCNIKWAPIHEQVTMLEKLLSHVFENYAEVQDDGYISDEDIDRYPDNLLPRPHILLTRSQDSTLQEQPTTSYKAPH